MSTDPVPLSPVEVIVLGLVRAAGRATPYDLKVGVAGSLGYFWTVPHSQLYAAPDRLVERGLLEVEQEAGGRRRKTYAILPAGETALDAWLAEPPSEHLEIRSPALLAMFFGSDPVKVASAEREGHLRRLAEFRRLAEHGERAEAAGEPNGPLITVRAGIKVHEAWLEYYDAIIAEARD